MTVRVNKQPFNLREKLSELERPIGLKGSELMKSETVQEARDLVSAGRKNFIINGSMMIYQRGSSTGVTAAGHYGADRQKYLVQYGTYTITQQADAPTNAGFAFSADIDCTTAGSPTASQSLINRISPLEGYDSERFAYGTSGAKTSTVSFWIKCSYADSFTLAIVDHDNQRSCFRSFTINQADTWEYKTLTFPGDTSGNGANNDNTLGLSLDLIIGGGTDWRGSSAPEGVWNTRSNNQDSYLTKNVTSFGTSTSHTMNITGVQWEFGHNATEFEHLSYGEELALCQRYYYKTPTSHYHFLHKNAYYESQLFYFPTTMRTTPTVTVPTPVLRRIDSGSNTSYTGLASNRHTDGFYITSTTTNNNLFYTWILLGHITADAEL